MVRTLDGNRDSSFEKQKRQPGWSKTRLFLHRTLTGQDAVCQE